jgi:hypothetical protein
MKSATLKSIAKVSTMNQAQSSCFHPGLP